MPTEEAVSGHDERDDGGLSRGFPLAGR